MNAWVQIILVLWVSLHFRALMAADALMTADLGSAAPPLKLAHWIKGKPLESERFEGNHVYVIVFLETGCDACVTSIPKLSALQKELKDEKVQFIGIFNEPVEPVKAFVEKMGQQLKFSIAVDDRRSTYAAYMGAFGKVIVPHAFIINQSGALNWQGHPLAGLDGSIREILAGKFDLEAAKKITNAEKMQVLYFTLVSDAQASSQSTPIGRQIVNDGSGNPWLLNNFAWKILTDREIRARDLELALLAAKMAYDAGKGTNSAFSDTYARALFENGKKIEAVRMQKAAISMCEDQRLLPSMRAALNYYESKLKN